MIINALCVFCGSSPGRVPDYVAASEALADQLIERDITLVYGGAHVGTMGTLADRMMAGGGRVIGVIPQALVDVEVAHNGLTDLQIVPDMHARKAAMAAQADGFIALPGGLGTYEELFEVLTWAQLGFHQKPCGVLNVAGFYDRLADFLNHAASEGFMRQSHRDLLLADRSATALLDQFMAYESVAEPKIKPSVNCVMTLYDPLFIGRRLWSVGSSVLVSELSPLLGAGARIAEPAADSGLGFNSMIPVAPASTTITIATIDKPIRKESALTVRFDCPLSFTRKYSPENRLIMTKPSSRRTRNLTSSMCVDYHYANT